jgi:misacylated tRNA(Ala) deacylase
MTKLLYQTDSYLKEFSAQVISVDAETRAIVLDQTAFYPGGGGQPCDFGALKINDVIYSVEKVKKQGDDVFHFVSGNEPLPAPGSASFGILNWARRY